jgi:autotransporter-associated beta strand protein
MRTKVAWFGVSILGAAMLLIGRVHGAMYTWGLSVGQTGDWSVASNWSAHTIPTSNDYAYVANGATATITKPGLTCNELTIGAASASGAVDMTSGQLLTGTLTVQNGEFTLSGNATLSTTNENISPYRSAAGHSQAGGIGTFNQTGGTHTVSNTLWLGYGGIGTYNIGGGALLSAGTLISGAISSLGSPGFMAQSGQAVVSANSIIMLDGSYSLGDNARLYAGSLMVGGNFNQTGGTNTSNTVMIGNSLSIVGEGLYGAYAISGNALLSGSNLYVGGAWGNQPSIGMLTQTGGTAIAANVYVGVPPGGSGGSYNDSLYSLSGGALLSASNVYLGGTITQSGGTASIANTLTFLGSTYANYTLSGGLLVLSKSQALGSRFNFNGGTLQAAASFAQYGLTLSTPNGNQTIDPGGYTLYLSGVTGPGNLIESGPGELVLSGNYTGGTTVTDGTLIVTNLASGTDLTVGSAAAFPAPIVLGDALSNDSSGSTVPEPASVTLVAAGAITCIGYSLLRRRRPTD